MSRPRRTTRRRCSSNDFPVESLEPRQLLAFAPQYAAQFANSGAFNINSVAADADGNSYIAGTFGGTVDFNIRRSGTFELDAADGPGFVAKYDAGGRLQWAQQIGEGGGATPAVVAPDPFGGVLLVGTYAGSADLSVDPDAAFRQNAAGNRDIFVIKLYPDGTQRFVSVATTPADENVVGAGVDQGGTVYVAANLVQSGQQTRGFVTKFNGKGNGKILGTYGNGTTAFDIAAMTVDRLGNVFLAGSVAGGGVDLDLDTPNSPPPFFNGPQAFAAASSFLLKYTQDGTFTWADGLATSGITFDAMTTDFGGNLYVAGTYNGTADFNPSVRKDFPLTSVGGDDSYVAKYAVNGALTHAWGIGGGEDETTRDVIVDPITNDVLVSGTFRGKTYFAPGVSRYRLYSLGGDDAYVARYTSAGDLKEAAQFGNADDDTASVLAAGGGTATLYMAGALSGFDEVDFDPSDEGESLLANFDDADNDGYLIKFLTDLVAV
jgi:hypothetical protein